jgi:hypothetical protein
MVYKVYDSNGDMVDTIECTLSLDSTAIIVGRVRYPVDLFMEAYCIGESVHKPYKFWTLGIDHILAAEIAAGYVTYSMQSTEYDGLHTYEL